MEGHAVWILLKKTKIPYDSTRCGHGSPFAPFQRTRWSPCFYTYSRPPFPVIAKPVQGSQLKFSYARNVSCYKLVIHHSRGDGTARSAPSAASTRTVRRLANIVPKHCPSRSRLLRQERIGKGLPSRRNPRSSVLDADKSFSRSAETFFAPCPSLRRTRALHRAGRELYIQSMEAG